jgi:hypothetical protein
MRWRIPFSFCSIHNSHYPSCIYEAFFYTMVSSTEVSKVISLEKVYDGRID